MFHHSGERREDEGARWGRGDGGWSGDFKVPRPKERVEGLGSGFGARGGVGSSQAGPTEGRGRPGLFSSGLWEPVVWSWPGAGSVPSLWPQSCTDRNLATEPGSSKLSSWKKSREEPSLKLFSPTSPLHHKSRFFVSYLFHWVKTYPLPLRMMDLRLSVL